MKPNTQSKDEKLKTEYIYNAFEPNEEVNPLYKSPLNKITHNPTAQLPPMHGKVTNIKSNTVAIDNFFGNGQRGSESNRAQNQGILHNNFALSPIGNQNSQNNQRSKAIESNPNQPIRNPDNEKEKNLLSSRGKGLHIKKTEATKKDTKNDEENLFLWKYFTLNKEMGKYKDFINFPWDDFTLDDLFSFMKIQKKTIPDFLDFYKTHSKRSNFLTKDASYEVEKNFRQISAHDLPINQVILNESQTMLITASDDMKVKFWNFKTGKSINEIKHESIITCVEITNNDKYIISGHKDGTIEITEISKDCKELNNTRKITKGMKDAHEDEITSLKLFNSDQKLLTSSNDKSIKLWGLSLKEKIEIFHELTFNGHDDAVLCIAINHSQTNFYSGSDDTKIKVWKMDNKMELKMLRDHSNGVRTLAITSDDRYLVSGAEDFHIGVWDLSSYSSKMFEAHEESITSLYITNNNKFIVSASKDKTVKLWDLSSVFSHEEINEIMRFEGHNSRINSICGSKNDDFAISCSDDTTVIIYDIKTDGILLHRHEKPVIGIALAPNGESIITFSEDNKINILSLISGETFCLEHNQTPLTVIFTPDSKYFIVGTNDNLIIIYSFSDKKSVGTLVGHKGIINALAVSNDGKTIFSGSADNLIGIWNFEEKIANNFLAGHKDQVKCLILGKKLLFSGSFDKTIKVWDIANSKCIHTLQGHTDAIFGFSISYSAEKERLFSCSRDQTIKIWDLNTMTEEKTLAAHSEAVLDLVVGKASKFLYSCSADLTIRVWNIETGMSERILEGHEKEVTGIKLSCDQKTIFSVSSDNTVRKWGNLIDTKYMPRVIYPKEHSDTITCIVLSKDNKTIYSGSSDKTIMSWNLETGKPEKTFKKHTGGVLGLFLSKDDANIYSCSEDKTIIKWNISSQSAVKTFEGHKDKVTSIILDKDEKHLISGSEDQTIRVWKVDDPNIYRIFEGHKGGITCICLSHDGNYVFSASADKKINQWNLETGFNEKKFEGHADIVRSIFTSKGGYYLISGSEDYSVRVWNIELGCEEFIFKGHTDKVHCVAIDIYSEYIVSCSKDRTIRIWNLYNGQENHVYRGHLKSVSCFTLTNDGKQIISACEDKTIRIWPFKYFESITDFREEQEQEQEQEKEKEKEQEKEKECEKPNPDTKEKKEKKENCKEITDLVLNSDNKYMISSSLEKSISVWNMETLKLEKNLIGHKKQVNCLAISGEIVFSGSSDHTIKVWNFIQGKQLNKTKKEEYEHEKAVFCIAVSSDGKQLLSGSSDNKIKLWDISELNKLILKKTFSEHSKRVTTICFFPQDKLCFASGSADSSVKIWNQNQDASIKELIGHKGTVNAICMTKDGKRLISGSLDRSIRIWNLETKREDKILIGPKNKYGSAYCVMLSLDEKHIISGLDDSNINVWNLETGYCEFTFEEHANVVTCLRAFKDGKRFISGSRDATFKIWRGLDPNNSLISRIIDVLETHDDDNIVAKICPEFKDIVFSYIIFPFNFSLLHYYAYKNDSLSIERILNILDILENKEFCLTTDIFDCTPIDVAFDNGNKRILNALFSYAIKKPPKFNKFPNFLYALRKASEFNLPNLEKIIDSRLLPLEDCLPKDDETYYLPKGIKANFEMMVHTFDTCYIGKSELEKVGLIPNETEEASNTIEFLILDIPSIVNIDYDFLYFLLDLDTNNLIFGSESLKAILHYKWIKYARKSYNFEVGIFSVVLLLFTINSVFIFPNRIKYEIESDVRDQLRDASLGLNIVLIIYAIGFIRKEIIQFSCIGHKRYFANRWNILDVIVLIILVATIVLDLISRDNADFDVEWLKALFSINVFLLWIKFISYARGYKETAFMVRMILQVILDIKVFLGIIFILCFSIGFSVFILKDTAGIKEMNVLSQFQMFNTIYRIILGDTGQIDDISSDLEENSGMQFLVWIFFFISTLFMMIIMLNLLISILGDSFDKISGRQILANNFEKSNIIYEIDNTLENYIINRMKEEGVFEKYLFIVRIKEEQAEEDQNERVSRKIERIEEKFNEIEKKMNENEKKMIEKNKILESKFEINHKKIEKLIDNLPEKIILRFKELDDNKMKLRNED